MEIFVDFKVFNSIISMFVKYATRQRQGENHTNSVRLFIHDNQLTLGFFNPSIGVYYARHLPSTINGDFVELWIKIDALRKLPFQGSSLCIKYDKDVLTLLCDGASFTVNSNAYSKDDMIPPREWGNDAEVLDVIDTQLFYHMVRYAGAGVATEQTRPVLMSFKYIRTMRSVKFAAADGFRLHVVTATMHKGAPSQTFLMPYQKLIPLLPLIRAQGGALTIKRVADLRLGLEFGDHYFEYDEGEGKFPELEHLVVLDRPFACKMERRAMQRLLAHLSEINASNNHTVKVENGGLSTKGEFGDFVIPQVFQWALRSTGSKQPSLGVALNSVYLYKSVMALPPGMVTTEITLTMTANNEPVNVVSESGGINYLAVIMPMSTR